MLAISCTPRFEVERLRTEFPAKSAELNSIATACERSKLRWVGANGEHSQYIHAATAEDLSAAAVIATNLSAAGFISAICGRSSQDQGRQMISVQVIAEAVGIAVSGSTAGYIRLASHTGGRPGPETPGFTFIPIDSACNGMCWYVFTTSG